MSLDKIIADIILDSARQIRNVSEPLALSQTLRQAGIETEPEIHIFKESMLQRYGAASANRTIELGGEPVEIVILKLENDLRLDPDTSFESVFKTTFEILNTSSKPTITIAEREVAVFDQDSMISMDDRFREMADASPGGSLAGDTTKGGDPE